MLNPTVACILLTIEMLVRHAVQGILNILRLTRISKAPNRKIEKTSDYISLFLVFLEILLLHATLRSLIRFTKALTFSYSLRAVETGKHMARFTAVTFESKFFAGHLHPVDQLLHFFFGRCNQGGIICTSQIRDSSSSIRNATSPMF